MQSNAEPIGTSGDQPEPIRWIPVRRSLIARSIKNALDGIGLEPSDFLDHAYFPASFVQRMVDGDIEGAPTKKVIKFMEMLNLRL